MSVYVREERLKIQEQRSQTLVNLAVDSLYPSRLGTISAGEWF
jgi:hypothetical protein